MIYTTGTIAGNGNAITGDGTNFSAAGSLIRNGCTLIAFTTPVQVLQITAVTNGTTLAVTPAIDPAIPPGTRYAILLSDSLSVDGLAQDIAETFGMYQRYMGGFADVMNSTGDVVITINGSQVTVPGQRSLAKKGANSDITSLTGLTTALSVAQGGTGGKNQTDGRAGLGAAASGANSDITALKGVTASITRDNWVATDGITVTLDAGTSVSYNNKAVMAITTHNGITLNTSFGYAIGADGAAGTSGPALICTDKSSYTRSWKFLNGSGIIATTSGNITPGASDERVKNIVREITEEEAVRIVLGLRPIRYAFKWSPDQIKVGYSAQNVEALDPELLSFTPLTIPDPEQPDDPMASVTIEDGKVVDPGEIGAAYLVPVVQQLLRRVGELEALLKDQEPRS